MEKHDLNKIDEYLLGNLSGDELASFEAQIQNDLSLQDAVKKQQELIAAVDTLGDLRMRKRVERIHARATHKSATIRRINFRALAMAAIGLVALGLCLWMWLRPPLNERLYADFYEPYPITFSSRSNDADRQLVEASRYYRNGEFGEAAAVFEKNIDIKTSEDGLLLAAGISFMEINNNDKALEYFNTILQHDGSPYLEHARWYSALVALEEDDIDGCKKYLEILSEKKDGYFYERAVGLLLELD